MSMKQEFTAHDMATAAADGFRDGQRAALDHSAQSLSMVGALVTALDGLLSITQDSAGVAGYHLNGEIAEWGEFPEVITARDVISAYRATDKESLTAADSQASADGSRKLSDLGNELHNLSCHVVHVNEGWAEQIGKIARELWNWPQASAAQSAPAGEREALQRLLDDVRDVRNADDVAFGWDEAAEYFAAAWQRTQSAGVPEGYALVPVEPTPEMVNAALENSTGIDPRSIVIEDYKAMLAAAPAQPAQGEFGDAYQGAREDLAIWKSRALEAEAKVRHQEQIIDHLTLEAQGETRMGEPVIPAAQDQGEVLTEHSGCGRGIQVDQLTVRMYPGDKVVMVRGRIGKALAASTGQEVES